MKVLATCPFPGPAFDELTDVEIFSGPLVKYLGGPRPGVGALAVIDDVVDEPVLELLPDLKVVASYGTGYDPIDIDACAAHGVAVTNTPEVLDAPVADMAFALLLAVRRRIVEADAIVRRGAWPEKKDLTAFLGEDVAGSTLGIVGLGGIGRAMARRARGFDMRVLYTKRRRLAPDSERELGVEYHALDVLLRESDCVALSVRLTSETDNLIDRRRLSLLRPGACLVNIARGRIVDQEALIEALRAGRLCAGLDVFAQEPHVPKALTELPNVVLAPHIGAATHHAREQITRVLVDNILAAEAGRPLPTPVYEPA